jgi:hypothetical protein
MCSLSCASTRSATPDWYLDSSKSSPHGYPYFLDGNLVAWFNGNTLYKTIDGEKHLLRTPKAIAWAACIVDDAVERGCTKLEVFDRRSRVTYRSDVERFRKLAGSLIRGYEEQYFLVLSRWDQEMPDGSRVAAVVPQPRLPSPQLSLFGAT